MAASPDCNVSSFLCEHSSVHYLKVDLQQFFVERQHGTKGSQGQAITPTIYE